MLRRVALPYRFLIDECLGTSIVPDAVAGALEDGESVMHFVDLCARGTKDEVWLRKAGAAGLVIITKDARLRFRPNERTALLEATTAVFMVSSGPGPTMAKQIAFALPTIRRVLRGQKPPVVGRVLDTGCIAISIADGQDVRKTVKRPLG